MVKDMCLSFLDTEVLPIIDRIDKLEPGLMPSLMEKAGEQGLLGASIPEEYGGLGKDFITSTLVNEGLGWRIFFFRCSCCTYRYRHTCRYYILVQKHKKKNIFPNWPVANGKVLMDLTEPNSGSDALGCKNNS